MIDFSVINSKNNVHLQCQYDRTKNIAKFFLEDESSFKNQP